MIGRILKERYKVIKKIGQGGMAIVYEAQDLLLDRRVALKMLRKEFVNDSDFVKKFRHEAKAVARLSHPNIVNIYDIGQDGEYHYLIMEYIEGENLKDIIRRRNKLTVTEALDIARQISAALAVAHQNNIIHCDIKPHNIILTPDQQVKVTDFGIARAATTSTTITLTETIIGSAHYFSPEQARGGEIKAHSDLYSLGIVLYEMLTGQVPFNGDSPISVALKHIQEEAVKPSAINPDISEEVDQLVMKAIAKEPEARFHDAKEMRENITRVLKRLQKKEHVLNSSSKTGDGDTKILEKIEIDEPKKPAVDSQELQREYLTAQQEKQIPVWFKWFLLIFSILILSGAVFFVLYQNYMDVPVVEVPQLIGLSLEEAQKEADQVGLTLEKQEEMVHHSEIPAGHIFSQYPPAGEKVRQTRKIMVTLSKGPAILEAPELINLTLREAEVILDNLNLEIGEIEYLFNDEVEEGRIFAQEPEAGQEVSQDSLIYLKISKGPQPVMVVMPNLLGLSKEEALLKLEELKLSSGEISEELSQRYKEGQVAAQEYPPGEEIPEGSKIDLTISQGLINLEGAEERTVILRITVPPGPQEQKIRIIVEDNNGRDLVYEQLHQPGDEISQTINSVGPTKYEIYSNDTLLKKHSIGG